MGILFTYQLSAMGAPETELDQPKDRSDAHRRSTMQASKKGRVPVPGNSSILGPTAGNRIHQTDVAPTSLAQPPNFIFLSVRNPKAPTTIVTQGGTTKPDTGLAPSRLLNLTKEDAVQSPDRLGHRAAF